MVLVLEIRKSMLACIDKVAEGSEGSVGYREVVKLHHGGVGVILDLDIWDSRLIKSTLLGADQGEVFNRKTLHPVDIDKFIELSGLEKSPLEAYNKALTSAKKLQNIILDIQLPNEKRLRTSIIYDIVYFDTLQTISIYWNEAFIPLISGKMTPGKFMFPAVSMVSIPSKKHYNLYLLLEQNLWQLAGSDHFILSKESIREVTNSYSGMYSTWGVVTAKVVKPTLQAMYNKLGIRLVSKVKRNNVIFSRERAEGL